MSDIARADIGVIGLAVMGENLVLNMENHGFTVACFNRTVDRVATFIEGRGRGRRLIGCRSLVEFVASLQRPRRIMMMVRAGRAVDELIESLLPLLENGDIIIDGGNSFYADTIRRCVELAAKGIRYVGAGVSGGEEGALNGPSIMPGGDSSAWPLIRPIFQAIAARAGQDIPCCDWIGPDGSGHFVKMVHNGIEYGDMQLICEAYHLLSHGLGMSADEMHEIFADWNRSELDSYLIEITAEIMRQRDETTGRPIIDMILDSAGQKGTGKWTSQAGLDLGVAIPQIAEAVFARSLSAARDERIVASTILKGVDNISAIDRKTFLQQLKQAVFAAKICSYAQGFQLLRAASNEFAWKLKYGDIALMWRGGCIIRAAFLDDIHQAFVQQPDLANLLMAPHFTAILNKVQPPWPSVIKTAIDLGIPTPAMSTALGYYDGYRSARLPANLLQAQRDFFGAHMYERTDRPRGEFFHTNWTWR
jgi:6-phosphogluconate dehydrogenase